METFDISTKEVKVFSSNKWMYLVQNGSILKCNKSTGKLIIAMSADGRGFSEKRETISQICTVYGLIGVIRVEGICYLLLIASITPVASLPCSTEKIFHIDKACALPVEDNNSIDTVQLDGVSGKFVKVANQKKLIKLKNDRVPSTRVIDEILRLFNSDGDFYVCFGRNLTLNTQSYFSGKKSVDDRFFWNKFLLSDLFKDDGTSLATAECWISPVCQGFVTERCSIVIDNNRLSVTLISRRSVERAGVRYLRRGVDADGNVANFVETEVIINVFGHNLSYVQVRGSVPVYWKQKGFRYRPPLIIDKPFATSFPAFEKHMNSLVEQYGSPVIATCLLDQTGRELGLALSYLHHIIKKDSPDLGFYAFDFHFYCRALRFQKVELLISALNEQLRSISFCWVDKTNKMVCEQTGVIRTNCVDCLDRTNVVQGAIAHAVCLLQLQKLGLVGPLSQLPDDFVRILQNMWADNGDAVSRQYAGTNALKGDVTRSGQRGLVGIMRDGYNSASRYYYSHMKDANRQMAIDTLLSIFYKSDKSEAIDNETAVVPEEEREEEESENIGQLVNETARFVLTENEMLIGGWALVDSSNVTDQVDTVLLLSRVRLMLAFFDDDFENLLDLKSIQLHEIKLIEVGPFEGSKKMHIRVNTANQSFTMRAGKTRLFNNVAIPIKNDDEANEYVQAIAEQMRTTILLIGSKIPVVSMTTLTNVSAKRRFSLIALIVLIAFANFGVEFTIPKIVNMVTSIFRTYDRSLCPSSPTSRETMRKSPVPSRDLLFVENNSLDNTVKAFCSTLVLIVLCKFSSHEVQNMNPVADNIAMKQQSLFEKINKMKTSKSQTSINFLADASMASAGVSSNSCFNNINSGPFTHFRQQILNSKSRIMLL
uniref:SAC domain-containing protein n=1 Tax=Syphacia muris TaxID=451379 RepID=A0A0N5AB61_9BILA